MAIAHIATTTAGQAEDNPVTGSIDSTGANLLVVVAVNHDSGNDGTVTDSKGNSWSELTVPTLNNNARARIYYSTPTTVGSGHTFTLSSTFVLGALVASAFSGAHASAPFDVENGNSTASGATAQPGSVTPSQANSLVIQGAGLGVAATTLTIDGAYSTPVWIDEGVTGGNRKGVAISYEIQTTATATNPTWTAAASCAITAVAAVFKPATGSPAPSPSVGALTLTGTGSVLGFAILMPDEL